MFDILSIIPGKKKKTVSGWTSFNCPCCAKKGHKADRKMRGGIKFEGASDWFLNCFNCGYSCNLVYGKSISSKTRQLLLWCGVDAEQVQRWNLESLKHRDILDFITVSKSKNLAFSERELPRGEWIDINNPKHQRYYDYLLHRSINPVEHKCMITPKEKDRLRDRIIIPYMYKERVVGYTSRFLDGKLPKYINDQQPGFAFGYDFQKPEWSNCILVEGVFDALSINACALMHNTISDDQVSILSHLNRRIIVVPDQDKAGLEICDRALSLGYNVSLPNWSSDIKDVNDAVVKYGKLPTLLSILQSATMSKIKIEMKRNKIVKNRK